VFVDCITNKGIRVIVLIHIKCDNTARECDLI
jgi:hypothetical protein